MLRKKYTVDLTEDQRDELENFIYSGEHRTQAVTRARILLKVDDSWTDEDVSEALDCGVSTVKRMRERFTDDGIAAMNRRGPDRTYERKLDGDEEARLIKLACSDPPEGYSQWSLRLLDDELVVLEEIDRHHMTLLGFNATNLTAYPAAVPLFGSVVSLDESAATTLSL